MALPWDFTSLVFTFDTSSFDGVTFERWTGNTQVIGGIAVDPGYQPLVLSPWRVYYPRVPKDQIEYLPQSAGNRRRAGPLIWSVAEFGGVTYDTLRTVDMSPARRPDRFKDAIGRIYVVTEAWEFGTQSKIAGAIGELLDDNPDA